MKFWDQVLFSKTVMIIPSYFPRTHTSTYGKYSQTKQLDTFEHSCTLKLQLKYIMLVALNVVSESLGQTTHSCDLSICKTSELIGTFFFTLCFGCGKTPPTPSLLPVHDCAAPSQIKSNECHFSLTKIMQNTQNS